MKNVERVEMPNGGTVFFLNQGQPTNRFDSWDALALIEYAHEDALLPDDDYRDLTQIRTTIDWATALMNKCDTDAMRYLMRARLERLRELEDLRSR